MSLAEGCCCVSGEGSERDEMKRAWGGHEESRQRRCRLRNPGRSRPRNEDAVYLVVSWDDRVFEVTGVEKRASKGWVNDKKSDPDGTAVDYSPQSTRAHARTHDEKKQTHHDATKTIR